MFLPNNRRTAALAALLLAASQPASGETALVSSGTPVLLALEHHVTSAYTPKGSDIRMRVAEDVRVGDRIVIARGTPARGRMRNAGDIGMVGTSAGMTIGVDFVPGVDGQQLRVVSSESRQGRDRGNALAGWTIFWGLPGLMTRGMHAFLPRGTLFEAQVLFDRRVAVGLPAAAPLPMPPPAAGPGMVRHRFSRAHATPYKLNLEREAALGQVEFFLDPPAAADGTRASLVAVDGQLLSEPVASLAVKGGSFVFDSWSVLQYCLDGTTLLRFRLDTPAGEHVEVDYPLSVKLSHRK